MLRTDRRTGREIMQSAWKGKKPGYGIEYTHLVSKCEAQQNACQNMLPKPSKTKPGQAPNPLKSRLGESLGGKMHSRTGPSQPRSGQERPTIAQEAPKKRPREARSRPRAPERRRSGIQERPWRGSELSITQPDKPQDEDGAGFLWEALFDTLRERFYIVFPFARQACDM